MDTDQAIARVKESLREGLELQASLQSHAATIVSIARSLADCIRAGGKVLIFGNGGSAAQAQHMAAELLGRFRKVRNAYPALALTADSSVLTSVSNDYGYEEVFARQIEALGRPGDVAIAISTSGSSENVLCAIEAARNASMKVVGLSGGTGMATAVDWEIAVPGFRADRSQELHLTAVHLICEIAEELLTEEPAVLRKSAGHGGP